MKMKKADEAHAAKAAKMSHPQWAEFSGWPPADTPVTAVTNKVSAKAKKVLEAIVAPVEDADGNGN